MVLTFDDGTTVTFTGPAVIYPGDDRKKRVIDVMFTQPSDLPDGWVWETVSDVYEGEEK